MGEIGTFHETMKSRGWSTEMLDNVAVKNRVYGLIEFDVTKAREYMCNYKEKTGKTLSFTGWMIRCIGQAVNENKPVQACLKRRKTWNIEVYLTILQ